MVSFRPRSWIGIALALLVVTVGIGVALLRTPQPSVQSVQIGLSVSLSGDYAPYGQRTLDGVRLAIEEANAAGAVPLITWTVHDDQSTSDGAADAARRVDSSDAVIAIGPNFSTQVMAAGPILGEAGLAVLPTTATSDLITLNPTTFRVLFKNSDQGVALATYLHRALGERRAAVVVVNDAYGRTLQEGFQRAAERLGIETQYFTYATEAEFEPLAARVAAEASDRPIVLLLLDADGSRILPLLRRLGAQGPFLGGDGLDDVFASRMADLPEERRDRGFFTNGMYSVSPVLLDSANADLLAFAERYRERYGGDPPWIATAGYDAARLAIAAARAAAADPAGGQSREALRARALRYLRELDSPAHALPGLLGPFWFDENRGRPMATRIARFHGGRQASAPIQIVPVSIPDASEIASGSVFEIEPGRYARLQRVAFTGVFVNEIPRMDLTRSSFNADFYLWLRFSREAGPGSADPTDIVFPTMMGGGFERRNPVRQREMPDGTEYWLWRVQGEFRNDFDLRRFPFDTQQLSLTFFNARAAMDEIVYALDPQASVDRNGLLASGSSGPSVAAGAPGVAMAAQLPRGSASADALSIASPLAFRNLSQWDALSAHSRRENLVTDSPLGDPTRGGLESRLELSGFLVNVQVQRRAIATLAKSLLPLVLMTLMMYASLYFPEVLVKEKVTVIVTAALSGAVLLTSIHDQLGAIGYTIAVEYAFYVFFGLGLLSTVSVLTAERLRARGRRDAATVTEVWTRHAYLIAVALTVMSAVWVYQSGSR